MSKEKKNIKRTIQSIENKNIHLKKKREKSISRSYHISSVKQRKTSNVNEMAIDCIVENIRQTWLGGAVYRVPSHGLTKFYIYVYVCVYFYNCHCCERLRWVFLFRFVLFRSLVFANCHFFQLYNRNAHTQQHRKAERQQ